MVTTFERPHADFDFHNSVICASKAACAFLAPFQTLVRFPLSKVSHTGLIYEAVSHQTGHRNKNAAFHIHFQGDPLIGKTEKGVVFSTERCVRFRMKIS